MKVATPAGDVSVAVDEPSSGSRYLILAHGAGGSLTHPGLISYAAALAGGGIGAVRFNFAYREAGRRAPDRAAVLESTYHAVASHVASFAGSLLIGGRSMGGRIGSHIVAQGFPCAGLVFLGYPLHPPGKPEKIRDAHLGAVGAPMLWIQGERDTFARRDLLDATLARLPNAELHLLAGGDHSLNVRGRAPAEVTAELAQATLAWAARLE